MRPPLGPEGRRGEHKGTGPGTWRRGCRQQPRVEVEVISAPGPPSDPSSRSPAGAHTHSPAFPLRKGKRYSLQGKVCVWLRFKGWRNPGGGKGLEVSRRLDSPPSPSSWPLPQPPRPLKGRTTARPRHRRLSGWAPGAPCRRSRGGGGAGARWARGLGAGSPLLRAGHRVFLPDGRVCFMKEWYVWQKDKRGAVINENR